MSRYVMKFHKDGYVKYTSHLDILRIFKRTFKKCGFPLRYSQGFNPHPKMGFAQPLSLGYSSKCELIEFETVENHDPAVILEKMRDALPEGLNPISCVSFEKPNVKSLAAEADRAHYLVWIPLHEEETAVWTQDKLADTLSAYLAQDEITAMKRQKKTKKLAPVDIKKMIRGITAELNGENRIQMLLDLDCGSTSNLSPELVITTFCEFAKLKAERYEIEVERKELFFLKKLQF